MHIIEQKYLSGRSKINDQVIGFHIFSKWGHRYFQIHKFDERVYKKLDSKQKRDHKFLC